jgi:predicted MPP superfamily phosphohydrolase
MSVSRRSFLKGAAFGLVGSVATAAYGDTSSRAIQLEQIELRLPHWKVDGLRVGFITDMHVNDPDEMARARHGAGMLAETSPDVLLFGGDCVNTNDPAGLENISTVLRAFEGLTCPRIAVLGNHDYWSNAVKEIERRLTNSGFTVLKNQIAEVNGYRVAGYDDRLHGTIDLGFQPTGPNTLVLMHEPDDVDVVDKSVSLQLSGHSHGGQICLPFGVPLHTPTLSRKYRKGYFPNARVPLYVSRGVGTTGFKWRMFCPPEVTLLTLRSGG